MTRPAQRATRRILWVANVFPPVGGKQGLRMVRYLQEICVAEPRLRVDVLTIAPSDACPQHDPALTEGIPPQVRVDRVAAGVAHHLRHRSGADQMALGAQRAWGRPALLALIFASNLTWIPRAAGLLWRRRYLRYDAIYVFVDPFTSLALGLLARRLNPAARLVLEYGDPRIPARSGPRLALRAGAMLEHRALRAADAAVFRTDNAIRRYQEYYPDVHAGKFHVVYGGVDWEDYDAIERGRQPLFTIGYTGTLYADSADIRPFIAAAATLARSGADLRLAFVGAESRQARDLVAEFRLTEVVHFLGHAPASALARIQRTSSVLLAFGVTSPYKMPSKLAEYLAARAPVLYVAASPDEPGARLVADRRRGLVVPNESGAIAAAISDLYQAWRTGDLDQRFDLSRSSDCSWASCAGTLHSLLTGTEVTALWSDATPSWCCSAR